MFKPYETAPFYDEMLENHLPRAHYIPFFEQLQQLSVDQLQQKHQTAQSSFLRQGITFTVYSAGGDTERAMPFDFIPIIMPQKTWQHIEAGMKQRVKALNLFLHDIYNEQHILAEGVVPRRLVEKNQYYYRQVQGAKIPLQNHIFLAGIDLIRDERGEYRVLEDNLRNPSGISYVYQNRFVMRKVFPEFFEKYAVTPLEIQMEYMQRALLDHRPFKLRKKFEPNAVLLTAGIYNSAYYDHVFLAKQMNIPLVEGRDLVVEHGKVYLKTIRGLEQVDVIYRRIDDDFLDPLTFREDSLLGVPGILDAYKAGHVSIVNAIGNGVADDKAMYSYVPDIIRYYLKEEPIIKNVQTYRLEEEETRNWVLSNIHDLVIKNVGASGGYDMLIGPHATEEEKHIFRQKIMEQPHQYIAQPTIKLSRAPAFQNNRFYPCHVDLRVFVMTGKETHVIPGGLSRVALKEGSLVVNSSQGGGGKDTWIVMEAK